jgi:hypothetical protein
MASHIGMMCPGHTGTHSYTAIKLPPFSTVLSVAGADCVAQTVVDSAIMLPPFSTILPGARVDYVAQTVDDSAIKLPPLSAILSGAGEKRKSPEGGFGGVEQDEGPPKAQTEFGPKTDGLGVCFNCAIPNIKCTKKTTDRNKNRACTAKDSGLDTLESGEYLTQVIRTSMLSKTIKTKPAGHMVNQAEYWIKKKIAENGKNVAWYHNMMRVFDPLVTVDDINQVCCNLRYAATGTQLSKETKGFAKFLTKQCAK